MIALPAVLSVCTNDNMAGTVGTRRVGPMRRRQGRPGRRETGGRERGCCERGHRDEPAEDSHPLLLQSGFGYALEQSRQQRPRYTAGQMNSRRARLSAPGGSRVRARSRRSSDGESSFFAVRNRIHRDSALAG